MNSVNYALQLAALQNMAAQQKARAELSGKSSMLGGACGYTTRYYLSDIEVMRRDLKLYLLDWNS